jgi:CheY-like chemotaxis protein
MAVTVLIVDDDADDRTIARLWLEDAAEDVAVVGEAAGTGEALGLIRALAPDVVLVDARMPPSDGFAVASEILALQPRQRMVMYSGAVDDTLRERALAAGFSDCLRKDDYAGLTAAIVAAARA